MAWIMGFTWTEPPEPRVISGDISFGISFENGSSLVPMPPAVNTALKSPKLKENDHGTSGATCALVPDTAYRAGCSAQEPTSPIGYYALFSAALLPRAGFSVFIGLFAFVGLAFVL